MLCWIKTVFFYCTKTHALLLQVVVYAGLLENAHHIGSNDARIINYSHRTQIKLPEELPRVTELLNGLRKEDVAPQIASLGCINLEQGA